MGVTAGSRFNAARRLTAVDSSFNVVLSLVSVAIIVLTVVPYIYGLKAEHGRLIALFTVGASVAILVLTNIGYGNRDLVMAEQLHRCALEINEIARRLDAMMANEAVFDVGVFAEEYGDVLQKYSVNHEKVDYLEHKLHRRDEYVTEYAGKSGMLKVVIQSLYIFWKHNAVWLVGVIVLVVCFCVMASAIGVD